MPIKQLDVDLYPKGQKVDIRAKRRVLSRVLEGSWTALLKGRGMEFAGFRQYTYGDDATQIDWHATLRANETLVRVFEEYKTVNVFVILDVSESMLFSSREKLKAEYAAEMMFSLASAIVENGNSLGYAIFSNTVIKKQMPGLGREVLYRLAADLQDGDNYGGVRDFKSSMNLINGILNQRSLIILVSDFIDLPDNWERYVRMFSMQFDLIGVSIRDPHDQVIPPLWMQSVVRSPSNSQELLLVDMKQYAKSFAQQADEQLTYVRRVFEKARAGFVSLSTDKDMIDPLTRYFIRRTNTVRS